MKKTIVSHSDITAANAKELSEKLGVSTVNTKGIERTNGDQSKMLKRMAKAAEKKGEELFYTTKAAPKAAKAAKPAKAAKTEAEASTAPSGPAKKAGMGEIFSRKGVKSKSQEVREMLKRTGEDFDRDKFIDKLVKKFNWTRSLAKNYMIDNYRRVFNGAECYPEVDQKSAA